jgi:hypothetical protein
MNIKQEGKVSKLLGSLDLGQMKKSYNLGSTDDPEAWKSFLGGMNDIVRDVKKSEEERASRNLAEMAKFRKRQPKKALKMRASLGGKDDNSSVGSHVSEVISDVELKRNTRKRNVLPVSGIRMTLVNAVSHLPREEQFRLLGSLNDAEGQLLRKRNHLTSADDGSHTVGCDQSVDESISMSIELGQEDIHTDIQRNQNMVMSFSGGPFASGSQTDDASEIGSVITMDTMDHSKFLPTALYDSRHRNIKKGLASSALKKIGHAMAELHIEPKCRSEVSLDSMVGFAELKVRLKTDMNIELNAQEIDQLMRKFDYDNKGEL